LTLSLEIDGERVELAKLACPICKLMEIASEATLPSASSYTEQHVSTENSSLSNYLVGAVSSRHQSAPLSHGTNAVILEVNTTSSKIGNARLLPFECN